MFQIDQPVKIQGECGVFVVRSVTTDCFGDVWIYAVNLTTGKRRQVRDRQAWAHR